MDNQDYLQTPNPSAKGSRKEDDFVIEIQKYLRNRKQKPRSDYRIPPKNKSLNPIGEIRPHKNRSLGKILKNLFAQGEAADTPNDVQALDLAGEQSKNNIGGNLGPKNKIYSSPGSRNTTPFTASKPQNRRYIQKPFIQDRGSNSSQDTGTNSLPRLKNWDGHQGAYSTETPTPNNPVIGRLAQTQCNMQVAANARNTGDYEVFMALEKASLRFDDKLLVPFLGTNKLEGYKEHCRQVSAVNLYAPQKLKGEIKKYKVEAGKHKKKKKHKTKRGGMNRMSQEFSPTPFRRNFYLGTIPAYIDNLSSPKISPKHLTALGHVHTLKMEGTKSYKRMPSQL